MCFAAPAQRLSVVLFFATLACDRGSAAPPVVTITASRWQEADGLFQRDPRWLGADAAFSVPLGGERILWLFGDTFVATSAAHLRTQSKMVRNTVALQTGADPSTASITFHWRQELGASDLPTSFFAEEGEQWSWPQHGIRVGGTLVLFLIQVRATPGQGLGFEVAGWRLALIDNPDESPERWAPQFVAAPSMPAGITLGAAAVLQGQYVVVVGLREPGDHAGYLARWPAAALAAGEVDALEWWAGAAGWVRGGVPAAVMDDAGAECSVSLDARLGKLVHVKSEGFGKTTVALRLADEIQGPWSRPQIAFRPHESDRPDAFVYAAKGHPELIGADLVVTYVSNSSDFATLLADTSIYYPRFVRIGLSATSLD